MKYIVFEGYQLRIH